ncbi:MAG: STAS/SEC14 domain-containing protein [Acidimicrobiia bacterium]
MLQTLPSLPESVIAFQADGKLTADDYKQVLIPAVEKKLATDEDVRLVLVFERFDGLTADAAWQDLKMGIQHFTHWKLIALVTDVERMIHVTHLFGWMTPGELKQFPLAEREAAIAWAASD